MEADLDLKAPVFRVLDFLEEVLLASASEEPSEVSLLTTARRLLGATGDILGILDTLRSLVSDSDIGGTSQRKCDPEVDSGVDRSRISFHRPSYCLAVRCVTRGGFPRRCPPTRIPWRRRGKTIASGKRVTAGGTSRATCLNI